MNQEIGKYIAEKRKKLNLTQEELAKKLHVSDKTISKWENNISLPDIEMLKTLSNVLEISPLDIMYAKDNYSQDLYKEKYEHLLDIKNIKKKYDNIFKLLYIIILVISCSLVYIFTNEYNKTNYYYINSESELYNIEGYIVDTRDDDVLVINNIDYLDSTVGTLDEIKSNYIKIEIYNEEKNIIASETYKSLEEEDYLHNILKNVSIFAKSNRVNSNSYQIKIYYGDNYVQYINLYKSAFI